MGKRRPLTNPKGWTILLPWAELWYNTAYHNSISMTPFQVVYGRDPPALLPSLSQDDNPLDVSSILQNRARVLAQLKHNLSKAQARIKKFVDKRRTEVSYEEDAWVFVRL